MSREHRTDAERKAAQARYDAMVAAEDARLRAVVDRSLAIMSQRTPEEIEAAALEGVRVFGRRPA